MHGDRRTRQTASALALTVALTPGCGDDGGGAARRGPARRRWLMPLQLLDEVLEDGKQLIHNQLLEMVLDAVVE